MQYNEAQARLIGSEDDVFQNDSASAHNAKLRAESRFKAELNTGIESYDSRQVTCCRQCMHRCGFLSKSGSQRNGSVFKGTSIGASCKQQAVLGVSGTGFSTLECFQDADAMTLVGTWSQVGAGHQHVRDEIEVAAMRPG